MDEEISLIGRTPSLIKLSEDSRESLISLAPSIYDYLVSKMFAIFVVAVLILTLLFFSNNEMFDYVFGNSVTKPPVTS